MRITAFPAITLGELNSNDVLLIESLGLGKTRKISLSVLASRILGGYDGYFNVCSLSTSQVVSNKRLNTCTFNSATATAVTSEDLNKIAGMTTTKAELEKLHGFTGVASDLNKLVGFTGSVSDLNKLVGITIVNTTTTQTITGAKTFSQLQAGLFSATGNATFNGDTFIAGNLYFGTTKLDTTITELNFLQGLTENLQDWMDSCEDDRQNLWDAVNSKAYIYDTEFTATSDEQTITESDILHALVMTRGKISLGLTIDVGDLTGSSYVLISPAGIKVTRQYTDGVYHLSSISIPVTSGHTYHVSICCRIL